jgi:hypothetical protein
MSEAEAEKDILTLELGDLKETLVSTKRNGRWGRGLQNNLKKVEARVRASLRVITCGGVGISNEKKKKKWGWGMYRHPARRHPPCYCPAHRCHRHCCCCHVVVGGGRGGGGGGGGDDDSGDGGGCWVMVVVVAGSWCVACRLVAVLGLFR